MKRLVTGVVIAALWAVPVLSLAEVAAAPADAAAATATAAPACPAAEGAPQAEKDACAYAEREAAAPQAQQFAGGADGVYIGGGVLAAALLVVLLVALL